MNWSTIIIFPVVPYYSRTILFLTDAQNLNPDALVYNSVLLWNSVLHLEHPDQLSKNLQYASSSFNESETFALLLFR